MIDIITSINENIAILLVFVWEDFNRVTYRANWKDTSPTTPAPPSTTPLPRCKRLSTKKWSWLRPAYENKYHSLHGLQWCHPGLSRYGEGMGSAGRLQKKSSFPTSDKVTLTPRQQVWWPSYQKNSPASRRPTIENWLLFVFLPSEQKAYLEKVKEERLVKEELMSQDEEEEIPVTEREMNLKVIYVDFDSIFC